MVRGWCTEAVAAGHHSRGQGRILATRVGRQISLGSAGRGRVPRGDQASWPGSGFCMSGRL